MSANADAVRNHRWPARHRQFGCLVRYSSVSVGLVVVEQVLLFICFGILAWSTTTSNLVAFVVLTGPAFYLNRRWVWGGGADRSKFLGQVVPFWVLAFLGLALSMWATAVVASGSEAVDDRELRALLVNAASLAAYGLVWIIKFIVLTTMVFNRRVPDAGG